MIESVFIIYSADVVSEDSSEIEGMSPARHLPAGHIDESKTERERIAAKFEQTEDDNQYDYGYLGDETGDVRYFPFGYVDSEGLERAPEVQDCPDCGGAGIRSEDEAKRVSERKGTSIESERGYCGTCEASGMLPPFGEGIAQGLGQHRKWVGELTFEEWQIFASAYCVDLDDSGLPERYEESLGSITAEHGHIPAIVVDNREGWEHGSFGYGPVLGVIDSQFYVSFAGSEER